MAARPKFSDQLGEFLRDLSRHDANLPPALDERAVKQWVAARDVIEPVLEQARDALVKNGRRCSIDSNGDGQAVKFTIQLYDSKSAGTFELSFAGSKTGVAELVLTEPGRPGNERRWPLASVTPGVVSDMVLRCLIDLAYSKRR